eukprot:2915876-Rhodomonas_salina.1
MDFASPPAGVTMHWLWVKEADACNSVEPAHLIGTVSRASAPQTALLVFMVYRLAYLAAGPQESWDCSMTHELVDRACWRV